MKEENRPKRSRARRGSAGDALILMAITLVAVAIGLGLFLQIGLSASNAAVGALALYAAFVGAHVLVRRSQAIRELTYEVDRLESEVIRLARGVGQRPPMPPGHSPDAHSPDQQLSSYRPGPQVAPTGGVKASHSYPMPQPDVPAPQTGGGQAPSNPSSRWGDAAAVHDHGLPERAPEATGQAGNAGARSDVAAKSASPVAPRSTEPQPEEAALRFWSVRPKELVGKAEDQPDSVAPPKSHTGSPEPDRPSKVSAGRASEPPALPGDGKSLPSGRRQPPQAADGSHGEAAGVDVNAINDMIRMFSEEIASPRKAPPSTGAPAPQAENASEDNENSDATSQEEAAISASVGALRAAADEMRRPPEPGRAATAIERGELPRFKADPSSSKPQPPPVGPEHTQAAAMADAIATHKLDVFLDPVVGLADRKARHFNVSLRLRMGESESLGPEDYVPQARRAGLLPLVDATRAARAAIVARHMDERGSGGCLFSAITAESLTSERFLQDFAEACRQSPKLKERLVFSIAEAELRELSESQWGTIQQLAGSGFRFAIQDLTSLDLDLPETKSAGFAFVRVAARAFLDGVASVDGVLPAADLCQRLTAAGLKLIVFDLESEEQLDSALAAGAPLGQGRLFGVPRPIRAEALRPARSAAA